MYVCMLIYNNSRRKNSCNVTHFYKHKTCNIITIIITIIIIMIIIITIIMIITDK